MPAQIDYSKRGWGENIFDPGAWRNLLGGVASVATELSTVYQEIEKIEGSQPLIPSPPQTPPPYQPNLTWRDFKFTPNYTLIAIGCGILLLAYALMDRKK